MAKGIYKEWLEPEKLQLIAGWVRDGLLDKQIAKNIGISERTFYEWKKAYPQFEQVLKRNKEVVDYEVENALFKSALGYYVEEETSEIVEDVVVATKKTKKWVQPSATAQIFWLKNRQPKKWRDRQDPNADANEDASGVVFMPERTDGE